MKRTSAKRNPAKRSPGKRSPAKRTPELRSLTVLAVAGVVLVSAAWLDDDAFITFRTVDNLLDGLGLTWNPVERVQASTHPLWLFVNAGLVALTAAPELSCVALSLFLSGLTLFLLIFRVASSIDAGCLAAGALLLSKAWVDYAGSGLEDPLTRLLLILLVLNARRPDSDGRSFTLALLVALAALNRPDAFLVFAPVLFATLYRQPWRRWIHAVLGLAPLALWGAFALFYFGSPWPNSAYAKLGTGVPRIGRIAQGLSYLLDSLVRDPATLLIIGLAATVAWRRRRRRETNMPLLIGGALYLLYVVWIGGSYMSGRFLGLPLTAAVLAIASRSSVSIRQFHRRHLIAALVVINLTLAARMIEPLVQKEIGLFGIGDERRTHHPYTGLTVLLAEDRWPDHSLRNQGEQMARNETRVSVEGAIGMVGFYAGPTVHIVDAYAISEPLLARLPGLIGKTFNGPHSQGWRPGHVARRIPDGYLESLPNEPNRITDPDLAAYYDVIRAVTRDPLWDVERLKKVVRLNLGTYDPLIESYLDRHR